MRKFVCQMAVLVVAIISIGFVSCSKSEDDPVLTSDNFGYGWGYLDKREGLRLKSIDNSPLIYDEQGRLRYYYYDSDEYYDIKYNPNKIVAYDSDADNTEGTYTVNGSGFLTSMKMKGAWTDRGGDKEEWTYYYTMEYDSEGHLTKMICNFEENLYGANGERGTSKGTETTKLTWSDNLLRKAVQERTRTETEDGETNTSKRNSKSTYTFTYNATSMTEYHNKYLQYAGFIGNILDDMSAELGWLGKGPANLPSAMEYNSDYQEDGEQSESYEIEYDYRYVFNPDGTLMKCIETEYYNYGNNHVDYTDNYTYETYSTESASTRSIVQIMRSDREKKRGRHRLRPFILKGETIGQNYSVGQ